MGKEKKCEVQNRIVKIALRSEGCKTVKILQLYYITCEFE
jgi:hypothetical protein